MDISRLPQPLQVVLGKLLEAHSVGLPGGFSFSPNLLQAVLIVILLFLLIYTLGHLRHTYLDWSIKGILPGLTFGFAIAVILEGLFLVGGKTLFTEILGWKDAPKPISTVLDSGRAKLVDVLGVSTQIPSSAAAAPPSSKTVLGEYKVLSQSDQEAVKQSLCKP